MDPLLLILVISALGLSYIGFRTMFGIEDKKQSLEKVE